MRCLSLRWESELATWVAGELEQGTGPPERDRELARCDRNQAVLRRVLEVERVDQGGGGLVTCWDDLAKQIRGSAVILTARAATERSDGARPSRAPANRRAIRVDAVPSGCGRAGGVRGAMLVWSGLTVGTVEGLFTTG